MTRRNLLPILIVIILIVLLTTQGVTPAASADVSSSETQAADSKQDAEAVLGSGHQPSTSPYHDKPVSISGGGSVNLIR